MGVVGGGNGVGGTGRGNGGRAMFHVKQFVQRST